MIDNGVEAGKLEGIRMTRAPDRLAEGPGGHPRDRLFAGRIDVGDDQTVGVAEGRQKFLEEGLRPGIPMGLEDDDDPSGPDLPGRGKRGPDLRRVMAVVVDHRDPVCLSPDFQPALGAGEPLEPLPDDGKGQVHLPRHRHRRQGVIDVEQSRNVELYRSQEDIPVEERETGGGAGEGDLLRPVVGFGRQPVGDHRAFDPGEDLPDVGIIQAEDRRAVERDDIGELEEGLL